MAGLMVSPSTLCQHSDIQLLYRASILGTLRTVGTLYGSSEIGSAFLGHGTFLAEGP